MAMTTNQANGPNAEMNVTPLIDVLLVLLIIFMVITPLTPLGVYALLPQPPQPNAPPPRPDDRAVVVQVLNDNGGTLLKINSESVASENLEPRLRAIFATRAERVVFVKGDENSDFESVAQVVNIAHSAGIDHVGLLTARIEAMR